MKEKLKSPREQAEDIDIKKRALEVRANLRFRKIFNNIAEDVSNLLLTNQNINSQEIAKNYKPDFIGSLRETYREVIRTFGFSLREEAQKKYNINFDIKNEKKKLEKKQDFETTESQEQEINRGFLSSATLFINNRSEEQADKITQTNEKEIQNTVDKSIAEYNAILSNNLAEQQQLNEQISKINLAILIGVATEGQRNKLQEQLNKLKLREERLKNNKNPIISKTFKDRFSERGKTRSEVISEFEVGQTEAFIRQTEAEQINNVSLIGTQLKTVKNWVSMGDSKVRDAHVIADATYHFNPIPVNDFFFVDGERLKYARDPNGSASNIIRCRCNNIYSII